MPDKYEYPDEAAASTNAATWSGILPGFGWPRDLLNCEDDDGFFTDHVYPLSDDIHTMQVVQQVHAQWRELFPDSTDRDRMLFSAGCIAVLMWVIRKSEVTKRKAREQGMDLSDGLWVSTDAVNDLVAGEVTRIVTLLYHYEEPPDLSHLEELLKK